MKKQLIVVGIILVLIAVGLSGCTEETSKWGIGINELFERNFNPGDTVNFEGTLDEIKTIQTSYGEYTIMFTPKEYIESVQGEERIGLILENEQDYTAGSEIRETLHIKEYQVNGHNIISPEEMYGLYLLFPTAFEIALDATSSVAGFNLVLKSIDEEGNTEYKVNSDGNTFSLDLLNCKLLKIKLDTGVESFSANIASSIEFFAVEYVAITGDFSSFEEIDTITTLEDKVSQNEHIEFRDINSNNLLDDNDIFNVYIPPTSNKYTFETYLLVIGTGEISSLNDLTTGGIKYIINWHKGVYSQDESVYD